MIEEEWAEKYYARKKYIEGKPYLPCPGSETIQSACKRASESGGDQGPEKDDGPEWPRC